MTLRVHMLYADKAAGGSYRVLLPAEAVNARPDLDCVVTHSDHLDVDATQSATGYRIRSVSLPAGIDVLVVQRPVKAAMAGALMWLRERRPRLAIVVDLDDDLANVPTSNASWRAMQPRTSPDENYVWLRRAIRQADVLTASTPEIVRLYATSSCVGRVVENAVPHAMTKQPARTLARGMKRVADADEDRVIGWAGTIESHAGDLEVTNGAIPQVIADTDDGRRISFMNVGPREGIARELGLRDDDITATGWVSLEMYRAALGQFDVGIVPLADIRFNTCKSWLKAIEFGAAAVPVIASNTPEHVRLRDAGMPMLLCKPRLRDWKQALRIVLDASDDELKKRGEASREFVRRFHTVEQRAPLWYDAWRDAAEIAQGRLKSAG